jgi:hypothetical protein
MHITQIALPLAMGTAGLAAGQWGAGAMVGTESALMLSCMLQLTQLKSHRLTPDASMLQGLVLASLAAFVFYLW